MTFATPTPPGAGRIPELEGLRGIAAWWVALGHIAYCFSDELAQKTYNKSAVDLFFVMSGFVVFMLLETKKEPYVEFLIRRFFRIFPVFFVVVLISAAVIPFQISILQSAASHSVHNGFRIEALRASAEHFWPHLVAHAAMIHGLVPVRVLPFSDITFVGQGWSISVEWVFYIIAPVALVLLGLKRPGLIALAAAVLLLAAMRWHPWVVGNSASIAFALPWLTLGALCFYIRSGAFPDSSPLARDRTVLQSAMLLGLALAVRSPGLMVWAVGWFAIGAKQFELARLGSRLLSSRPMVFLGKISYSTYLIHMLAIYASLGLLRKLKVKGLAFMLGSAATGVILTFCASYVLFTLVEAPMIALGHRLAKRWRTMMTGGIAA